MTRFRDAGLWWPTLLTLLGLAILVSLGSWQLRRLAWKEALIERVEKRANSPAVSLQAVLGIYTGSQMEDTGDAIEFRRVALKGRFHHDLEFHVWNPGKRGPAWSVVTPLTLSNLLDAESRYPLRSVLVIRGTVLDPNKAPAGRAAGSPDGELEFVGRVRLGHVGAFSNSHNAAKNEWYEFDIEAMRKAVATSLAGAAPEATANVAPFFVEAETATGGPAGPQPDLMKVNLTNRHLEYALTWYGLAVTLLGVYLAFAFARMRLRR